MAKPKIKHEVYRTPEWVYSTFCKKFPALVTAKSCLDPTAGDGRFVKYLLQNGHINKGFCVDILKPKKPFPCRGKVLDFFKFKTNKKFNLIITNPPFSLAEKILYKAAKLLKTNGKIILLLRLGFLASKKRKNLHKKMNLSHVIVLGKRPIWEIDGVTKNKPDNSDYAFFIYQPKSDKVETKLKIIFPVVNKCQSHK
jgi:predicted rRNA methylase YqxC with S4 and FtsJ domains